MATRLGVSVGLVGAIALFAAFALPANEGLASTSTARFCDRNSAQVFRPWNDSAYYMLSPGGSFEAGAPAWTLTGHATVVAGNESFYIHSPSDRRSLSIPAASGALRRPASSRAPCVLVDPNGSSPKRYATG